MLNCRLCGCLILLIILLAVVISVILTYGVLENLT